MLRRMCVLLVLLTGLCTAAMADIPQGVDYWVQWDNSFTWISLYDRYNYGLPIWNMMDNSIRVPNRYVPGLMKEFWVEAVYWGQVPAVYAPLQLNSLHPAEGMPVFFETYFRQDGSWVYKTYHWQMSEQCSWEALTMPSLSWFNLWHDLGEPGLQRIEIGTLCTPEPSSLLSLAGLVGASGILIRRRKRS